MRHAAPALAILGTLLAASLGAALPSVPPPPEVEALKLWSVDLEPGEARGMAVNALGETFVVGTVLGGSAVWKLDPLAAVVWAVPFGGRVLTSVAALPDGGVVVGGHYYDAGHASADALVLVLDADGNEAWSRTLGTTRDENVRAVAAGLQTLFIAGASGPHLFVARYDLDGTPRWSWSSEFDATLAGYAEEAAEGLAALADGSVAAAGWTYDGSANRGVVLKLDEWGRRLWLRFLAPAPNLNLRLAAASVAPAGDLLVAGAQAGRGDISNPVAARFDRDGELRWRTTLHGESRAWAQGIASDPAGGAVLAGSARAPFEPTERDWVLARLTPDGKLAWSQRFDTGGDDEGRSVAWLPTGLAVGGTATGFLAAARYLDAPVRPA